MSSYKAKISPRNKKFLEEVKSALKNYNVVGVVDVTSLPAPQFQSIRSSLVNKAKVLICKKNIVEIAFKSLDNEFKNISKLLESSNGIIGLIFTNENPFKIFKFINKNKSQAKAKAGQVAPNDIVVAAGPTSFSPGPIIGELGSLKIKAGINAGKVEIKEDCVVAKEGEVISDKLAGVLSRLDVTPMEIGLNIKSIYENEEIYLKDVLDIDEKAILEDLKSIARNGYLLSVGIKYTTKDNISYFVSKSYKDSLAVALKTNYVSKQTIKKLLQKASNQKDALSLKST